MFNALKFDEVSLTHLNYHWFWGLRYSKTPQSVNLGADVGKLMKDESKLADIINSQANLYINHNAMARFFYWLFNINNYSYHAYLLAACKGHQNYLSRSLEKGASMTTPYNIGWGILASGMVAGLGYAGRRIYRFLTDAAETNPTKEASDDVSSSSLVRLLEAASKTKREATTHLADVEAVIVTAPMLAHLKVLGIDLNPGDTLKLSVFKSTCRARYLSAHPDKGGTTEEFRRAREAAESLITIMSSRDHSRNMHPFEDDPDKYWADFNASMDEVWANLAKAKADWAVAKADWAEVRAKWAEASAYSAETNVMMAAELRVLQEQMREFQQKQGIASSSSFSAPGAPGLFAPDTVRAEGQEELHAAEPGVEGSNSCH